MKQTALEWFFAQDMGSVWLFRMREEALAQAVSRSTTTAISGFYELFEPPKPVFALSSPIVTFKRESSRGGTITDMVFRGVKRATGPVIYSLRSAAASVNYRIEFVRSAAHQLLLRYVSILEANLLEGFIFGGSHNLPFEVAQSFKTTGLQHVVAASGANVALVTGLANYGLRGWVPRRIRGGLLLATTWLYVLVAGAGPSLIRAAGMASLAILATTWLARQHEPLRALGVVAVGMCVIEPEFLQMVSFQLSVGATLGILWWTRKQTADHVLIQLERSAIPEFQLPDKNQPGSIWRSLTDYLKTSFALTMAAQILTVPLILWHFQQVSVVSVLSNIVTGWLTPLITVGGVIFLLLLPLVAHATIIKAVFGHLGGFLLGLACQLFVLLVQYLAKIPWALVTFETQPRWLIGMWMACVLSCVAFDRLRFIKGENVAHSTH